MARKNMFEGLEPRDEAESEAPTAPSPAPPEPKATPPKDKGPSMGALGALSMDLSGRNSRMVQDLDPSLIESSGHRDRLDIDATDIDALARSMTDHGQQVPILVRPLSSDRSRYQIVYGRRRLAAARRAGLQIKAMVRTMGEEEAVLAQGQENSQRTDPTFIEKAVFAADLRKAGYETDIITDALAIDRTSLSRMEVVLSLIPMDWICDIGPAPDVGRRRWHDVALRLKDGIELPDLPLGAFSQAPGSLERFEIFEALIADLEAQKASGKAVGSGSARAKVPPRKITTADGREIGEIRSAGSALTLKVLSKQNPEFGSWLEARADQVLRELFEQWSESSTHSADSASGDNS